MTPGRSRKPDRPARCQSSSRPASCAGVPMKVVASLVKAWPARSSSRAWRLAASSAVAPRNTTRSAKTCTRSPPGLADLGHDRRGLRRVTWRHEADVRRLRDQRVHRAPVPERGDDRLALRRPGRDRGALDAEVLAGEIDVVQLVAVDEQPGRGVADLRVVLPAVPQPPDRPRRNRPPRPAAPAARQRARSRRPICATSSVLRETRTRTPGPALAGVVEGRDGLGDVERLGVGDDDGRHQPAGRACPRRACAAARCTSRSRTAGRSGLTWAR